MGEMGGNFSLELVLPHPLLQYDYTEYIFEELSIYIQFFPGYLSPISSVHFKRK